MFCNALASIVISACDNIIYDKYSSVSEYVIRFETPFKVGAIITKTVKDGLETGWQIFISHFAYILSINKVCIEAVSHSP